MPVFEARGLVKELRTGSESFRLTVPDFRLHAGEVVGLSGRSGSGKSTFLDILALISLPSRVEHMVLRLDGQTHDMREAPPEAGLARLRSRHFGYVLQSGGLLPYLSIAQNAALPWALSGRAPDRDRIAEVAGRLGLDGLLLRRPQDLSGGQRQRASVLRALAPRPAVVLCDEPTASVDVGTAEAILAELRALARESGSATVLVSHDAELLAKFSDRICRLTAQRSGPTQVEAVLEMPAA